MDKVLNSRERKGIVEILQRQYGFDGPFEYVVLMNKKNKLYLSGKQVFDLALDTLRVNALGLYFGELYEGTIRLSIEGSQIVGPRASKNVVELDEAKIQDWVKAISVDCNEAHEGFVIVKHKGDFYGCGKTKDGVLLNYVPKARSLRVIAA